MDIAMPRSAVAGLFNIINIISSLYRISNIEKTLSEVFENLPAENPVNYIGDLNKSDIMH